ncbi:MAG: DNA-3-methyladenine glycosylase I [Planctomycetes bacterium]|nr:DNA-3-methyladenine glycosylase I [Planctomycetota bacterium]
MRRCDWAGEDPLYVRYHDEEWGVPVHEDRRLFEMLILEGAQAGLSWLTILRKRVRYREVYAGFDPARVAKFTAARNAKLLSDPGIVRNRQKVAAAVGNARAFLAIQDEHGSFARWLWSFVDRVPIVNRRRRIADVPARTPLSDRVAEELTRRGFRFCGSTIVQAYLQAVGVIDDHLVGCHVRTRSARR